MQSKYIFITGGVVSSLGKGLTSASLAMLLEARGLKVALLKLDPYLNVDPGTMNPFQHGEVYVTDDGCETDLDLGHYYRFTHAPITRLCNATSGQIYETVIRKERQGDFLGHTVMVVPHITDEIKRRIINATSSPETKEAEVVLVEIGGTAGDIESLPFLEAIRQFRYERPRDCINIHLTYVPYLKAAGEVKSKPTQHSVQVLRAIGIIPDLLLCRCENPLSDEIKEKISIHCSVPKEAVIDEIDVEFSIYQVPLYLHKQGIDQTICALLGLDKQTKKPELASWEAMLGRMITPQKKIRIGIVGKYIDHKDAYKSVFEALQHAATFHHVEIEFHLFESEKIVKDGALDKELFAPSALCDGYVIPGGFGKRGWEGKILVAKLCRENHIPYFGICLGMQVLCVEFARNCVRLEGANSTEMDPETPHPIISLLSEQKKIQSMGATMRLGAFCCQLDQGTKAYAAYKSDLISERHRHRYEFNNQYKKACMDKGLVFSGRLKEGELCEITEVKSHPWMVGVQFHPEFKSKPTAPHPLFIAFIEASLGQKDE